MDLTIDEVRLLIEAVGTLEAEYGLDERGVALLARLREVRARREAEISSAW